MTDLVISGLMKRRGAMIAEMHALHGRLEALQSVIPALEAVIRVIRPEIELEALKSLRVALPRHSHPKDTTRASLEILRQSNEPMVTRDIARRLIEMRGLNVGDRALLRVVTIRVLAALRRQRDNGSIKSSQGDGVQLLWEISR